MVAAFATHWKTIRVDYKMHPRGGAHRFYLVDSPPRVSGEMILVIEAIHNVTWYFEDRSAKTARDIQQG